jgi:ABC-type dipeptide/oligopeptide/nickel transport system permease component
VLGFHTGGVVAQTLGASISETRGQGYVTAAKGKGIRPLQIELRHVLPNAILPVFPLLGVQAGFLLGGTVITEIVFARPGLGRLMLDAVLRRDVPVVQGLVLLAALVYALCTAASFAAARLIDPRTPS